VPSALPLLPNILELAHTVGHEGIQNTLQRIHADFYVVHDRRVVHGYVRACSTCQCNKTEALHPTGLLQPLPVPSRVWANILMDFIEALLKVHVKSMLLNVVDRFSKYAHFILLRHPYRAASIGRAFFSDIVWLHSFPKSIVSDRNPVFTGHV